MRKLASPKKRAPLILECLKRTYPDAHCELGFRTPLELLIATILSAQCTDARVNLVTPVLFKKYRSASDYANSSIPQLESLIRSTGFYKNKARSIKNCCRQLVEKYGGGVPVEMDDLTELAGVGRKTANVVRAYAFGLPGIICDTHVLRVSARLGLTKEELPDKVESDLAKLVPQKDWSIFSTVLMFHGRRCCAALRPLCPKCPVLKLCPFGQGTVGKNIS